MLAWSLENHRMFCIAMGRDESDPGRHDRDFYDVAGIGMIRACRAREDETSDLILQGIARVRLNQLVQLKPFRMAAIEFLVPSPAPEGSGVDDRMAQVRSLCRRMREPSCKEPDQVDEHLAEIDSPDLLCDVVANTFIGVAQRRQKLLEELDVARRLTLLTTFLLAEMAG
jgi:ATP-dependent Lon protease